MTVEELNISQPSRSVIARSACLPNLSLRHTYLQLRSADPSQRYLTLRMFINCYVKIAPFPFVYVTSKESNAMFFLKINYNLTSFSSFNNLILLFYSIEKYVQ